MTLLLLYDIHLYYIMPGCAQGAPPLSPTPACAGPLAAAVQYHHDGISMMPISIVIIIIIISSINSSSSMSVTSSFTSIPITLLVLC